MGIYKRMYLLLYKAASDAVCQMRNGNELNARALLIETLQKCDELTDRNDADKADK